MYRYQNRISCLVEAWLRTWRKGVLIADLPRSYPSSRTEATLVKTDAGPLALSQGFLNSPILKYLGGDYVIWQSSPC
mgnify:CR=1 FL=1